MEEQLKDIETIASYLIVMVIIIIIIIKNILT